VLRWMLFFLLVLVGITLGVASILNIPLDFFNHPTYSY
jgi:hypothetical protein